MWSYNGGPSANPTNEVRFLVGDTNASDPLLDNEEIDHLLTLYPKKPGKPAYLAAAAACDAIANKLARELDRSIGALSRNDTIKYDHYVQLAQQHRTNEASDGKSASAVPKASPILGGGGPKVMGI